MRRGEDVLVNYSVNDRSALVRSILERIRRLEGQDLYDVVCPWECVHRPSYSQVMQDAFIRDMFSISDLSNPRYNGHVQVSSLGKSAGGKRDRKGCTKGKIEAIMKNNPSRPKFCLTGPNKKLTAPVGTNQLFYPNHAHKAEETEDPYTFAEPEPQAPTVYQHQPVASVAPKKASTSSNKTFNMVCSDKTRVDPARVMVKTVKSETSSKNPKVTAESSKKSSGGSKRKRVESTSHRKSNEHTPSSKRDPSSVIIPAKREPRKSTWQRERNSKHELLERIHSLQTDVSQYKRDLYPLGLEVSDSDSDESDNARSIYERDWFMKSGTSGGTSNEGTPREQRVEATRAQLRRRLAQTIRGLKVAEEPSTSLLAAVVAAARKFPNATAAILDPTLAKKSPAVKTGARFLLTGEKCSYADCQMQALPCTRHCFRHIMYNVDQRLFSHCTSRGLDSMQCNRPTFDIRHDPPLCSLHALHHEPVLHPITDHRHSKKVSKKSRVLGVSRTKKNNKKRKKSSPVTLLPPPILQPPPISRRTEIRDLPMLSDVLEPVSSSLDGIATLMPPPTLIEQDSLHSLQSHVVTEDIVEEVPEEVLAIANLDPTELANQAARLLEDPDLHILNQISTDAFNDLFTDKNGEYEPTREETEELERALEAVDNDVRSLERMSRSLPLLNLPLDPMTLLDDPSVSGPFTPFQNGLSTTDIPHS